MAEITITMEEVMKCKECPHLGQRTKVKGFLADSNEHIVAEVCHECEGVLEGGVLTYPLAPYTFLRGLNKRNIELARQRQTDGNANP